MLIDLTPVYFKDRSNSAAMCASSWVLRLTSGRTSPAFRPREALINSGCADMRCKMVKAKVPLAVNSGTIGKTSIAGIGDSGLSAASHELSRGSLGIKNGISGSSC